MDRIIAGRFESAEHADAVVSSMAQLVAPIDICVFYNSPPGQQLTSDLPLDTDSGTEGAGKTAATSALGAGIAAGAVGALGGPLGALAAAGIGAYAGSLVGALKGMGNQDVNPTAPEHRQAGMMVAVRIANPADQDRVIALLRAGGAADIEQAQGEWSDGDWTDFDPLATPNLVA